MDWASTLKLAHLARALISCPGLLDSSCSLSSLCFWPQGTTMPGPGRHFTAREHQSHCGQRSWHQVVQLAGPTSGLLCWDWTCTDITPRSPNRRFPWSFGPCTLDGGLHIWTPLAHFPPSSRSSLHAWTTEYRCLPPELSVMNKKML